MSWNMRARFAQAGRFWSTLAFRLTAWYVLAALALVVFTSASLYFLLVTELKKSADLFLSDKIHVLRTMLRERPDDRDGLREEIELESAARRYEQFYIRLLDERNVPILTTPGMAEQLDLSRLIAKTQSRPDRAQTLEGRNGRLFLVMSAAMPVGGSPQTDTAQIAIDISQQQALLARYRHRFGLILLGTLAIFPLVGYQIARRGICPVREMAVTARHISSTNLNERIQPEGYPSELASLAATFNQMLDRLQESFERISRFSADIAHDLRIRRTTSAARRKWPWLAPERWMNTATFWVGVWKKPCACQTSLAISCSWPAQLVSWPTFIAKASMSENCFPVFASITKLPQPIAASLFPQQCPMNH